MRCFLFFSLFLFFFRGKSQVPDADRTLAEWIDPAMASREEEEAGESEVPAASSINLNTADIEQLRMLPLPVFLIESLISYRILLGPLLDMYELQAVPGWDLAYFQKILPFAYVADEKPLAQDIKDRIKNGQQTFSWQVAAGTSSLISSDDKLGDGLKMTVRYRFNNTNSLQFGWLADKDAGEPFSLHGRSPGFDFWSAHFLMRNAGPFRMLALGDYSICLGQGLIQWQGFSPSKGADAVLIKKQAPVISAYRSAGECNYYRGAAMRLPVSKFNISAFFSFRRWDANAVYDSGSGKAAYVTSVLFSGLHRTEAERDRRSLLDRISWGGSIQREIRGWKLGINMVSHHHSLPVLPANEFQNVFSFRGRALHGFSVDYGKTLRNIHLFGELACSDRFSPAWIQGLMVSLGRQADISFLYRNISPRFHSLQARAFTETISPHDEKGFYSGISLYPSVRWHIQMSADLFQSGWPGYRMTAPRHGSEYRFQAKYVQRNRAEIIFKMLYSRKNAAGGISNEPVSGVVTETKNQLSIDIHLYVSRKNEFNMGFSQTISSSGVNPREQGYLYYMSFKKQAVNLPLGIQAVAQYFKADSYAARIYINENQLINSSGFLALYGAGYRISLGLRYAFSSRFQIQLHFVSGFPDDHNNVINETGVGRISSSVNMDAGLRVQYSF